MIRTFAAVLAISTVRLVSPLTNMTLTAAGVDPRAVFVITVVLGWAITLGAAEAWIHHIRRARVLA